jgi:hypothetical protein
VTALAFRAAHAAITAWFLFAIGYVWSCALTGRRDTLLRVAVTGLIGEGALVMANGGDCPLGGLQERVADPTPCSSWCSPHGAPGLGVGFESRPRRC